MTFATLIVSGRSCSNRTTGYDPLQYEEEMLSTGLHIPKGTRTKLIATVAEIHRRTADTTLKELRKAPRERYGPTIAHFIRVDCDAQGTVEAFEANRLSKLGQPLSENGFVVDVPIIESAGHGAESIARQCGEYLLRSEIRRRTRNGLREFIRLTDDELSAVQAELAPLRQSYSATLSACGYLSERLRLNLIEREIEVRKGESAHYRLEMVRTQLDYLAQCRKVLQAEAERALHWREQIDEAPFEFFFITSEFRTRSHLEQSVIGYRNWKGWNI